jgi:hypothetical protein
MSSFLFVFSKKCLLIGRNSMEYAHRNNHIFCYNSGRCEPIVLIFELDRDINKMVPCTKFHHNRISLWRVIVYRAGHTDRFYSVLTFWVHKRKNMISRTKCIFEFQSAQSALCFSTQTAGRVRLQKTDIPRTLLYRAHSVIRNAGYNEHSVYNYLLILIGVWCCDCCAYNGKEHNSYFLLFFWTD